MSKIFITLAMILTSLSILSCSGSGNGGDGDSTPVTTAIPTLETIGTRIGEENASIRGGAEEITATSNAVGESLLTLQTAAPDPQKPIFNGVIQNVDKIKNRAAQVSDTTTRVDKDLEVLAKVSETIRDLEKKAAELTQLEEKIRQDALKRLYGFVSTFWVIGFVIIVGGAVVAFFANKAMGVTIMLVGGIMVGFAAASQFYMKEIAQVGGILLIGMIVTGVVILVRSLVRNERTDTAVKELVEMFQILKETMTEDEDKRIFGEDGLASKVQTDITKAVVSKIKEKGGLRTAKDVLPETPDVKPVDPSTTTG